MKESFSREHNFKHLRVLLCMLLVMSMAISSSNAQAASVEKSTTQMATAQGLDLNKLVGSDTTTEQPANTTYKDTAKEFGQYFVDNVGITSMQVAIMDKDAMVYSDTFGYDDINKKTVPAKDTMYGIGSVSKMYVTAAVMKLVDQGKVELDKPVTDYITDFKMKDSRYQKITVRMLLNHSSGILSSHAANAILYGQASTTNHDNFLKVLADEYLQFEPGSLSVYNNDGFTLAEILVERITKQTFTKYLEQEFFTPLGLTKTKTPQSNFNKKGLAKSYVAYTGDKIVPDQSSNAIGAFGMYSTAEELCKFSSIFMYQGNNSILSDASKRAMSTNEYRKGFWITKENRTLAYGLGWDSVHYDDYSKYGINAYYKTGDALSHHGVVIVLPDNGISISVLCNAANVGSSSNLALYANKVLQQYLTDKNLLGSKKEEPQVTYQKADLPADVDRYTGTYVSVIGPEYTVTKKENSLIVRVQDVDYSYHYTKEGYYVYDIDSSSVIRFLEHNGHLFMENYETADAGVFGTLDLNNFLGQKLENNLISSTVTKAWKQRSKKTFYLVSELPSSYCYTLDLDSLKAGLDYSKLSEGYVSNMTIVNKNLCYHQIEVPMTYGRAGYQFNFYTTKGVEYCNTSGYVYMGDEGIKTLANKKSITATIPKTGYNQMYKIGSKTAKKKATFSVPKNASFVIYDKKGNMMTNYYLSKKKTVVLPKDGMIVLIGNKNAKFKITLK